MDALSNLEQTHQLIIDKFPHSPSYLYPFRYALALAQQVCFSKVPLTYPSLDIGVNDGSTAAIIHHGKGKVTWGGDMPEEATYESRGLFVSPEFDVYENLIGMDICNIPFPDNSFNTVVSTEVLFYGMDRSQALKELTRVLAPGGTLAISESSQEILKYPALVKHLKHVVPSANFLEDPEQFYLTELKGLGMTNILYRPYFRGDVAAQTIANMWSPPFELVAGHQQAIQSDPAVRAMYEDGLKAIFNSLAAEFSASAHASDGFHCYVECKKPGTLNPDIKKPQPSCVQCRSSNFDKESRWLTCLDCGQSYKRILGHDYLLGSEQAHGLNHELDDKVGQRTALATTHLSDLGVRRISVYGVDRTTKLLLSLLENKGIVVDKIISADQKHHCQKVVNTSVYADTPLEAETVPLYIPFPDDHNYPVVAELRNRGFKPDIFFHSKNRERYEFNRSVLFS